MKIDPNSVINAIPAGPGVAVSAPKEFGRIAELAQNLWWTWDHGAHKLWSRMHPRRWSANRNPLSMLQGIEQSTWEALLADGSFVDEYDDVMRRFSRYMAGGDSWYQENHADALAGPIAYLCAEFGVHHTLPFYSGGLGVLAGDHAKAASDLGLPFVGVGLLYRRGYFHQSVDPDGHQQHHYLRLEETRRPFREVLDRQGHPLRVRVEFPGREVAVRAYRVDVGRVPLLLLDTALGENDPADRPITSILYVRGREMRFAQEMVLGIGSVRVIEALGLEPATWHVNEGHAALSLLERLSKAVGSGLEFDAATKSVQRNTLFTLHTPVPAGNEVFDLSLAERYVDGRLPGVPEETLAEFGLAREEAHGRFDMGALAIRLSSMTNGVSQRHGEIVTESWSHLIGGDARAITNGVHAPTWVGRAISRLYTQAIGADWWRYLTEPEAWATVRDLPDADVWDAHNRQKEILLRRLRGRLMEQRARHGAGPDELRQIDHQLPADRLTLVFARRFATYKRAGLLFSDPGRAHHILTDPDRPVQVIFTGKAHPADREGQAIIRWISELAASAEYRGHVFFIEDYDMQIGGWLVSGADAWLNNPRPPQEASGTSGMKAAANGVLNLSVLDGWWPEGWDGENGNGWGLWGEMHGDAQDAQQLYHLLETDVVPAFYERDEDGLPTRWIAMMKEAMATITPAFSTHRMVKEYFEEAYLPLGR